MIKAISCLLFVVTLNAINSQAQTARGKLDALTIEVSGSSREVVYTNKRAGVFYTETNAEHRSPWQGWRVMSAKMLEDYAIAVDDKVLRKEDATRVRMSPFQLMREYPGGLLETVTLLDSLNALVIELDNVRGTQIDAYPLFSDSHRADDYVIAFDRNILMIGHMNHRARTRQSDYPAVVAASWVGENAWTGGFYDTLSIGKNFCPANTRTVNPSPRHVLVIAVGDSLKDAVNVLRAAARHYDTLIVARKNRMERLLAATSGKADDPQSVTAFGWGRLSSDALVMDINRKGIFEGLPLFDAKKRKSLACPFPGATLMMGDFNAAKQLLTTYSEWQDTNATSNSYGTILCDSADITAWFTNISGEYLAYSRDTVAANLLYPAIRRGIEGTLKYRTNKSFVLTGDRQTDHNDVSAAMQCGWYEQLGVGVTFARIANDKKSMDRWNGIRKKLAPILNK